ncbi:hypothetical protein [Ralstonia sp. UBA689]|uniref:hypothetical protein n=1 Tax=Ralstonia sp. UBA689 TaxID=1947373 RepID=UPI0025E71930|nr:hypothetical protein [Ralstonia sp. UBA689]
MQDNTHLFRGIFLTVAACAALAGCGGGDMENGVTALTVSPNNTTITSPGATCPPTDAGSYFIYGGKSPYTVANSLPAFMTVSTSRVNDVGGSFSVKLLGGCITPGVINVTDAMGRLTTVSITYQAQQPTTTPLPQ